MWHGLSTLFGHSGLGELSGPCMTVGVSRNPIGGEAQKAEAVSSVRHTDGLIRIIVPDEIHTWSP